MPDYPIDLGMKAKSPGMPYPERTTEDSDKVHYPSIYLNGVETDLPDGGEITIKFKKLSETKSTRDGKTDFSCELEIHEIVSVKASSKKKASRDESEDALDKLREDGKYEEED